MVTVDRGEKQLRYHKYLDYSQSLNRQIERIEITNDELPKALLKAVKITNTKPFKKDDQKWLNFSAEEKVRYVMSGGMNGRKKGKIFAGDSEKLTSEFIRFLSEQNFI